MINNSRLAVALLAMTLSSGCITSNDLYYFTPAEKYSPSYRQASSVTNSNALKEDENLSREIRKSVTYHKQDKRLLGTVNFRNSENPEDPIAFQIRKEERAYMAETPIGEGIKVGDKNVQANFAVGLHKDHKGMVGLVFRMPF